MSTGTDERKHDFFQVDNEVIDNYDLSPLAGWLYMIVVRLINDKTDTAFPSLVTLSRRAKMSKPSVIKFLLELEEKKLIVIERRKKPGKKESEVNHYRLLPVNKVVNGIDNGGKADLPPVVNDVDCKNTNSKNTDLKNHTDAPTAVSGAASNGQPKRARTEKQLKLDAMKNALADAFGLPYETVTHTKWGEFGKAGAELIEVGATPGDMKPLFLWSKTQKWARDGFTSIAMAKYWPDYVKARQQKNGAAVSSGPSSTLTLEKAMYGGES